MSGAFDFNEPGGPGVIGEMAKTAARSIAGQMYCASSRFSADLAGKVLILMYHRVVPPSDLAGTFVQPGLYVTPETFERHLQFLTAQFQVLSFRELLERWRNRTWDASARYCTVTFDDGWLDNYSHAFPLLRRYGVPATIFVPTEVIGTDRWLWFDRLGHLLHEAGRVRTRYGTEEMDRIVERAKALPERDRDRMLHDLSEELGIPTPGVRRFINWTEARHMSQHGVTFGSHTSSHALLPRLDAMALEHELRRPLEVLAEERVAWLPVLAYPNGDHDAAVVEAARAAGYQAAVTTRSGPETSRPDDLLRLRRIGLHEDMTRSIPLFAFHVGRQMWNAAT